MRLSVLPWSSLVNHTTHPQTQSHAGSCQREASAKLCAVAVAEGSKATSVIMKSPARPIHTVHGQEVGGDRPVEGFGSMKRLADAARAPGEVPAAITVLSFDRGMPV